MKKYLFFTLTLVLTAAVFTGCGCTSQDAKYTTAPTTIPTVMTTTPTTEATQATTAPTAPTADRGNGPLEDAIMGTDGASGSDHGTNGGNNATDSTTESRARQVQPSVR